MRFFSSERDHAGWLAGRGGSPSAATASAVPVAKLSIVAARHGGRCDIDPDGARAVGTPIGGAPSLISERKGRLHVIEETDRHLAPIALFCSMPASAGRLLYRCRFNAGGPPMKPWSRAWAFLNGHVYAARIESLGEGSRRRLFPHNRSPRRDCSRRWKPLPLLAPNTPGGLAKPRNLAQGHGIQGFHPVPAGRRHQHLCARSRMAPQSPATASLTPEQVAQDFWPWPRAGDVGDPAASQFLRLHRTRPRITTADRRHAKIQAKMRYILELKSKSPLMVGTRTTASSTISRGPILESAQSSLLMIKSPIPLWRLKQPAPPYLPSPRSGACRCAKPR